jgi:hypothetical protein
MAMEMEMCQQILREVHMATPDLENPTSLLRAARRSLLKAQQDSDDAIEYVADMWAPFQGPKLKTAPKSITKAEDDLETAEDVKEAADIKLDELMEVVDKMEDMVATFEQQLHSVAGNCPTLPGGHKYDIAISTRPKYMGQWMAKVFIHYYYFGINDSYKTVSEKVTLWTLMSSTITGDRPSFPHYHFRAPRLHR